MYLSYFSLSLPPRDARDFPVLDLLSRPFLAVYASGPRCLLLYLFVPDGFGTFLESVSSCSTLQEISDAMAEEGKVLEGHVEQPERETETIVTESHDRSHPEKPAVIETDGSAAQTTLKEKE